MYDFIYTAASPLPSPITKKKTCASTKISIR